MNHIYIVLPAYNEEKSISQLLDSIEKDLFDLKGLLTVIIVNDGSKDKTAKIIDSRKSSLNIFHVKHETNKGLGNAIKTGFKTLFDLSKSDDDIAIFMDADNTHLPIFCINMINKMNEGWDIVIASRYCNGSEQYGVPLFRRFLSFGARILFSMTLNINGVRDYTCGFRAYKLGLLRKAHEKFEDNIITRNGFACTDEILFNLSTITDKITEVPFTLRYDNKKGVSKIKLFLTISETIKMLQNHRNKNNSK